MTSWPRQTIANPATVTGHGLHTGAASVLTFAPARSGGVRFIRQDLPGSPAVPAVLSQVTVTDRRTRLASGVVFVETVEHVLAAVWSLGLHDLEIRLDGPEPPIGDGSASHFVAALRAAGAEDTTGTVEVVVPDHEFTVTANASEYRVSPAEQPRLEVTIEWDHPMIGRQTGAFGLDPEELCREVLPSRTFAFAHELADLRAAGLIRGGTLDTAVVLSDDGVLGGALRWPDEFVRHKTLDLIGDLALLGRRYCCHISAWRPGHRGNIVLAHALNEHRGDG